MKKIMVIMMTVFLLLSITGCSVENSNTTVERADSSTQVVSNEAENSQGDNKVSVLHNGDKIVSRNMEITINSVELTYDVLPDDTSGFYTHYEADVGNVYISVDASVKNIGKHNIPCDEIGRVKANYNNGYIYSGFVIVKDSSTGFTYANISDIDPLETVGIKWLIKCPQEVEETDNPLSLEIKIDSDKYTYIIR